MSNLWEYGNTNPEGADPTLGFCDLCGLPLRFGVVHAEFAAKPYSFCCMGCRQVFQILLEAADSGDPGKFRETELFKLCQKKGIIPKTEADVAASKISSQSSTATPESERNAGSGLISEKPSPEALHLNLKINNMWCPACAWVIDESLKKSSGIVHSKCNFSTDSLFIEYNPAQTSPSQIIESIKKLGYRASACTDLRDSLERKKEFIRFTICAFLTVNVMMLSYALYSGFFTELTVDTITKLSWPAFVMATIVLSYGGYEFYRKAWAGLLNFAFSMETLIIMGSASAYFYSVYQLYAGSIHVYFDTASMLITLVLLGKILESRAKGRVLENLEIFFSLKPTKVTICTSHYPQGRCVAAEQLAKGDIFKVSETDIVPADGNILSGSGAVDTSSLTGEPLPVVKKPGDPIRSGTRILKGTFQIKAENVGEDSTLGQMIGIIEKTLLTKTPLEGKTDILLQWFVPLILALAAGTALVGYLTGLATETALLRAITVMVISCPCALGIAIPLARVAGISIAGKKGILVRDFKAFEQTEKVGGFIFDKTGTVTEGCWNLLDIIAIEPMSREYALALAAGLEKDSDHFIATEILTQANQRYISPVNFTSIITAEKGITGILNGRRVKIGSANFFATEIDEVPSFLNQTIWAGKATHSYVYLGIDETLAAVFAFGDSLRTSAPPTIRKLRDLKYRLAIVSGDSDHTTRAIGQQLGISESHGGKLPQDKAAFVRKWQEQGIRVAMVGDGINDAPALLQSDLAMAIHSGNPLSKEAADVTLMRGEPGQIVEFLELASRVNAKIYHNLMFAFLYNAISIPIAMCGLLTPVLAVTAMLLSSLSVIGNTLVLVKQNPRM